MIITKKMIKLAQIPQFKTLLILLLLLPQSIDSQAQRLLDNVLRRSKQKIGQKMEDMIVEKVSDAVAQKVYASMSNAFDKMLADAIKQDSVERSNYGDSLGLKYGELANAWMNKLNESADLSEKYSFSRKVYIETTDRKEVTEFVMYLSTDQPLFAMEQEENGKKRIFLLDVEKDVTVMYMIDKSGKKTAQAIPNMMGLGAALVTQMQDSVDHWDFDKTGKSKKIAGYTGEEYKGVNDDYETTFYLTDELGDGWRSTFSSMLGKFTTVKYGDNQELLQGFMLESHTVNKKKKKDQSSWVTKSIDEQDFEIVNADYEFGGLQTQ